MLDSRRWSDMFSERTRTPSAVASGRRGGPPRLMKDRQARIASSWSGAVRTVSAGVVPPDAARSPHTFYSEKS